MLWVTYISYKLFHASQSRTISLMHTLIYTKSENIPVMCVIVQRIPVVFKTTWTLSKRINLLYSFILCKIQGMQYVRLIVLNKLRKAIV